MLFSEITHKRKFADGCFLLEGGFLEHDFILQMTELDPSKRPTSYEIKNTLLPKLKAQINDQLSRH